MQLYQFGSYLLSQELPQLTSVDGPTIDLEPKQHQLLLHFCRHPNVIVSRDNIIEHVNKGVVVSDNAVNKMVANLRQVLADNPRSPQYIKTIPKQGYCFIESVVQLDESDFDTAEIHNAQAKAKSNSFYAYTLTGLVCLALLLVVIWQSTRKHEQVSAQNAQLIPLTRNNGVEFSPAISPNSNLFVYFRHDPANAINQLWLRHLDQDGRETLLDPQFYGGDIAWSPDSSQIIYTSYHDQTCRFEQILDIQSNPTKVTLADCDADFVTEMRFAPEGKQVFYIARPKGFEPMQLFSLNLADKTRQVINQPALSGMGNYGLDLSPDGSKLLILSADESYLTKTYQLLLADKTLTQLGQFNWLLPRAIWHHDGKTIVHTSNIYSHELQRSEASGKLLSTLVGTSNRVAENYQRHPNGKDFYFTSFMMNNDIELIDTVNHSRHANFNSAVYDKLPTFGGHGQQWFFASKQQGITQIFSADETSQSSKQLTHFAEEPQLFALDATPNGQTLAIAGHSQITIKDIHKSKGTIIPIKDTLVRATHWLDNHTLAISTVKKGDIKLWLYHLNDNSMEPQDSRWLAAFASPTGQRRFWVEHSTKAVFEQNIKTGSYTDTGIRLPYLLGGNGLAVRATETSIIHSQNDNEKTELIAVDLATGQQSRLGSWLYMAGFDAFGAKLLVSYEQSRTGDVVMTQFNNP